MQHDIAQRHSYSVIISLISAYLIYAAICLILKSNPATANYAGILLTTGDTILNVIIVVMTFWLWKNASSKEAKLPFGFFALSFSFATIPNALYQILFNILHLNASYFSVENIQLKIHHFLYAICLLFEFAAWASIATHIFSAPKKSKAYKTSAVSILVVIFLSVFLWKYNQTDLSLVNKYFESYITSFYIINFVLAMLCLAVCKNKSLFYLSLGYMMIVGADLIMEFGFMSQYLGTGSMFDTIWFLGLLFVFYGFWNFKKNDEYKLSPALWVSKPNSIKTQSAIWSFVLCSACLSIFLAASNFFTDTSLFF